MSARRLPADVAGRFGARADGYEAHAQLQRAAAQRLAALVAESHGLPTTGLCLEIGCGTGLLTRMLAPQAQRYLATDISPQMLERCRASLSHLPQVRFRQMDGQAPELAENPVAVLSNLTAQWFRDPPAGLARLAGLAPFFAFSLPVAGSFSEWERAFADLGRTSGLRALPEEAAVREALAALPGRSALLRLETIPLRYPDGRAFAESFRRTGADLPRPGYRPGPIRDVLRRFAGGMDATALVLYGVVRQGVVRQEEA